MWTEFIRVNTQTFFAQQNMKSWLENIGGPKMTIGVGVSLLIGGAASVYLILQSAKLLR